MATHAPITGAPLRAPGNPAPFATSRRGLLASLALAPIAAVPAIAATPAADRRAWCVAVKAVADAKAAQDAYERDVIAPIEARFPKRPEQKLRVGTDHRTGEPLMRTFWPSDFDDPDCLYRDVPAYIEAAPAWRAWNATYARLMAETDYDAKEDRYDDLVIAHCDAIHACLVTPAPDTAALAEKLLIAFDDFDGPDLNDSPAVREAIRADAARFKAIW